ncbi:MAG: HesA/MoeB/ThiF family protein [Alphaproteobacteria bacterium]
MTGSVAIVGVGGLGAPAAAALATTPGARLTLVDHDVVEISNLPRQPLYGSGDVGLPKAEVAARRLRRAHRGVHVEAIVARVTRETARDLLAGHVAILDGTDGLDAKVLLNQASLDLDTPLVHAGAIGFEGQLTSILPGRTACLRCLFVELPDADEMPTCQQAGVLGPVVGAIGLAAAREAVALQAGRRPPLADRLAIFSGRALAWRTIELRRNSRCPACAGRG